MRHRRITLTIFLVIGLSACTFTKKNEDLPPVDGPLKFPYTSGTPLVPQLAELHLNVDDAHVSITNVQSEGISYLTERTVQDSQNTETDSLYFYSFADQTSKTVYTFPTDEKVQVSSYAFLHDTAYFSVVASGESERNFSLISYTLYRLHAGKAEALYTGLANTMANPQLTVVSGRLFVAVEEFRFLDSSEKQLTNYCTGFILLNEDTQIRNQQCQAVDNNTLNSVELLGVLFDVSTPDLFVYLTLRSGYLTVYAVDGIALDSRRLTANPYSVQSLFVSPKYLVIREITQDKQAINQIYDGTSGELLSEQEPMKNDMYNFVWLNDESWLTRNSTGTANLYRITVNSDHTLTYQVLNDASDPTFYHDVSHGKALLVSYGAKDRISLMSFPEP